jgi:hypothetical protein
MGIGSPALLPRKCDAQQACSKLGIFIKHLVKIAHAVKQQHVGVLFFQAQVLRHHRGVALHLRQLRVDPAASWHLFDGVCSAAA